MANSCVFMPKNPKRAALFKELKSNFGYDTASKVYNRVVGDEFINAYKDSLTLSEGVPTYASVMSIPVVQKFIGDAKMLKALNGKQPHLPDTLDNTAFLINKAREFNTDAQYKSYVAIVDYDDNGELTLKVERRDKDNVASYAMKLIQDALRKIGYLSGDGWNQIENFDFEWDVDKKNPRIEVEIQEATTVSVNIFDIVEEHEPCHVQVLRNSVTGECSIGWRYMEEGNGESKTDSIETENI